MVEKCRPDGIIVQFGGQTPLKLATPLAQYLEANPIPAASGDGNVRIWGTQPESIDAAEDRDLWYELLQKLQIKQPPGTMVSSEEAALKAADSLGYPVMVRRFCCFVFTPFFLISLSLFCFRGLLNERERERERERGREREREREERRGTKEEEKLTFFLDTQTF